MLQFLKKALKWTAYTFAGLFMLVVIVGILVDEKDDKITETVPEETTDETEQTVIIEKPAPPAKPEPETKSKPQPVAKKLDPSNAVWPAYRIVEDRDSSFGNIRTRVIVSIKTTATTENDQIRAMMAAAVDRHRKTWPDVVAAKLKTESSVSYANSIYFALDGCGWAGEPCDGKLWSQLLKGSIPQELLRWGEPTEDEKKAAKDTICRNDLRCWGDKHQMGATFACQPLIEQRARYSYEWTDGWLGSKLTQFRWKDRKVGTLSYYGDKVKFQNGFGAWQRVAYWCHYNPATKTAEVMLVSK